MGAAESHGDKAEELVIESPNEGWAKTKDSMEPQQRLDKWLWFARVAKTRSLAARLVAEGHVRLNARRIETPAKAVGPAMS